MALSWCSVWLARHGPDMCSCSVCWARDGLSHWSSLDVQACGLATLQIQACGMHGVGVGVAMQDFV